MILNVVAIDIFVYTGLDTVKHGTVQYLYQYFWHGTILSKRHITFYQYFNLQWKKILKHEVWYE
jgi:hypothetical protein